MISRSQNNEGAALNADIVDIVLQTFDKSKILGVSLLGTSADAVYEYVKLEVRAGGRSVQASGIFVVSKPQITSFVQELLAGTGSRLEDENGGGSISIEPQDRLGHFIVRISIGGIEDDQASISFMTDQTAIATLKHDLAQMLVAAFG